MFEVATGGGGSLKGFKGLGILIVQKLCCCRAAGLSLGKLLMATSEGYIPKIPVLTEASETAEASRSFFFRIKTSAKSSQWTFASLTLLGAGKKNWRAGPAV